MLVVAFKLDSNSGIYVLGEDLTQYNPSIFDRNASSGAVTFVTSIEEGRDGVAGLTEVMSSSLLRMGSIYMFCY